LLNGSVEQRDGDRLVVADPDPAALNARMVAAGIRVTEIAPERHSLEEMVLAVTTPGSDHIGRAGPAGEGDRQC
jgi:ABC-2 type transport system ATP-binding protein